MKIWIIKRKGANWWANLDFYSEMTIGKESFWVNQYFLRKRDALMYLKTRSYQEFFEVVGCSLPENKQDNRNK